MSKTLVIVESPAKAKTIQKYLGPDYEVVASLGHVRDLPKNSLGVNIEKGFKPMYLTLDDKEQLIAKIKKEAASSDGVLLATDPDREGEAISWHLAYLLGLDPEDNNRVTFDEITKKGISEGMKNPRAIDMNLVNAQQARRILDRIVGYKLSPFLWKKVRRGLSAGRVQSVVLRMIVDLEREIQAFKPEEYWVIEADLRAHGSQNVFKAKLKGRKGAQGDLEIKNKEQADGILKDLEGAEYTVEKVQHGTKKRVPEPPFITSTLQQDASRKFGFTARRTMRIAQELYEGISLGEQGSTGLITYMRTDSLRISDEAHRAAQEYIEKTYGPEYVCRYQRKYKSRGTVAAQDAHEAIRPTNISLTPDAVSQYLTPEQKKLYKLIWDRFIASRMTDQVNETMTVDIGAAGYVFRTSGYRVEFDGYSKLYNVSTDDKEEIPSMLPRMNEGDSLVLKKLDPQQKFTQPPQRYTEASIIKALEENGIGRPSTYAPILSTVIGRGYVERDKKHLVPTQLGMVVSDLMTKEFPDIVDVGFSADMEKDLDKIEEGKADWVDTLSRFYKGFSKSLEKAEKDMQDKKVEVPEEVTDVICEKCGRRMVIKTGKYGKFLACPGFPECRNTKRLEIVMPGKCPKCGGKILQRRSSKGRIYYSCEKGRECGFMTWNEPTDEVCPKCGSTLFKKKGRAAALVCEKEGCGYSRPLEKQ
ncbi:MAG: type I DNA topoisomerase [Oscillospiraceae bacterium]|jgi:DNA topoisomerase-1